MENIKKIGIGGKGVLNGEERILGCPVVIRKWFNGIRLMIWL